MTISINSMNDMLGRPSRGTFDTAHGPWPDHIDTFHSLGGNVYLKSRVDRNGNVLSCDLHEDSMDRLVRAIRSRYE